MPTATTIQRTKFVRAVEPLIKQIASASPAPERAVEPSGPPASDSRKWPVTEWPFKPKSEPDARAVYAEKLIQFEERPHEDEQQIIADYWALLMGLEAPHAVVRAAEINDDLGRRMLLQAAILGGLDDSEIATAIGTDAAAVESYRLLFFDTDMPGRAARFSVLARYHRGDATAILPALASGGRWWLVEMVLGLRKWSPEGQAIMDGIIARKTWHLLLQLWAGNTQKHKAKGNDHKIVTAMLKMEPWLQLGLATGSEAAPNEGQEKE